MKEFLRTLETALGSSARNLRELSSELGAEESQLRQQVRQSDSLGLIGTVVYNKKSSSSKKQALVRHAQEHPGEFFLSWYKGVLETGNEIYSWRLDGLHKEKTSQGTRLVPHDNRERAGLPLEREKRRHRHEQRKRSIGIAARQLFHRQPKDAPTAIARKLDRLRRQSLVITIDGSTTNEEVARQLATLDGLTAVTFITNDRTIEDILRDGRGERPYRIVFIGGVRRNAIGTYVGPEAEAFFLSLGLTPDIAFIGVTEIDSAGRVGTSDFSECRLKALLLGSETATLRCLCADSSKIHAEGGPWSFATLATVDLLISDRETRSDQEFMDRLRAAGTLLVTEQQGS